MLMFPSAANEHLYQHGEGAQVHDYRDDDVGNVFVVCRQIG